MLDFEKLSRINQHHVVFRNNPNKLYEMNWTLGAYREAEAKIIYFRDISEYMELEVLKKVRPAEAKNIQLERAREYIVEHFDRNINFKELCKTYHMSYSHFIRSFKLNFGVPPKDYQINLRLKRAKEMLVSGEYKIKEVAMVNGYEDDRIFYQLFLRHEGITPRAYIKKHRI